VRKLEERSDIGRALSVEVQARSLEPLRSHHTPHVQTLIPLLLLTGMRAGESLSLTWGQVDFFNSSGTGRVIPINSDLAPILLATVRNSYDASVSRKESTLCFPGVARGQAIRHPVTGVKHAWETLRASAGVSCRLHDLRHTFATRLAGAGVPESTMLALMGLWRGSPCSVASGEHSVKNYAS
jgi:integrase